MDKLATNNEILNYNNYKEYIFDDDRNKEQEKKILKELEQKKKFDDAINSMTIDKVIYTFILP